MQKIRTYFQNQKENMTPSHKDFEILLSKIEIKPVRKSESIKRSPFMLWSFASVSFAAFLFDIVSVLSPTSSNDKLAMNTTNTKEAINTIDSVQSFKIQNDKDF